MWRVVHMRLIVGSQRLCAASSAQCVGTTLSCSVLTSTRHFFECFEEERTNDEKAVAAFAINADRLEKVKTIIDKKAYGIPFHISDAEAVDRVCRHHRTSVEIHGVERYLMPFWLLHTAAGGTFRGELLQRDPAFMTQQHCLVWVEGPNYEFSYPFGEYLTVNQVSASYVEPLNIVEECLAGSHVPSMLISRFELVKHLEEMSRRPKVIPFSLSTSTALSIVEKRLDRKLILSRIDSELRKFHGSFIKSNITVTSVYMEAVGIRPVFLPLMKLMVSTTSNRTPVPAFICGATGKVVGPVLHVSQAKRAGVAVGAALGALLGLSPLVDPGIATALAVAAGVSSTAIQRQVLTARFLQEQAKQLASLQSLGILNFGADNAGYRWSAVDEEKEEYEYREEMRRRAREKDAFEQRVKEEAARDAARAQGHQFDPKNRRRTDLIDADPLGFYELLGLKGKEFSASAKEISKAFREAVSVHHPDVNPSTDAEEKKRHLQKIIAAYKVLHDPKRKKSYDAGEMTAQKAEE